MTLTRATLFKVTALDGQSCHGGAGRWALPRRNADGTWTPGEPREVTGLLEPCQRGLHLCRGDQLLDWLGPAIWVAEYDTTRPAVDAGDKVVVTRARLARGTAWNDRVARHFACDCAERALALVKHPDERSVAAIRMAREFADGRRTAKELAAARDAARDAAWNAARDAARAAAWDAARAAAWDAARAAAWDAERDWQTDRLLAYLNGEVAP